MTRADYPPSLQRKFIDARWRMHTLIDRLTEAHKAKIHEHAQQHRAFINRSIGQSSRHIWR